MIHLPYGYEKSPFGIRIVPEQADCVQTIYRLYLSGMGYRRIASYLNQKKTPTPSMCRYRHSLSAGKASSAHIAFQWSDHMVREILKNDFYTGTYRLHNAAASPYTEVTAEFRQISNTFSPADIPPSYQSRHSKPSKRQQTHGYSRIFTAMLLLSFKKMPLLFKNTVDFCFAKNAAAV